MSNTSLNEIEDLRNELAKLRHENEILTGLMVGGYAYFLRQFMVGHQAPDGLASSVCDRTIVDALKRVLATQDRFGYEYLSDIEAVLKKMTQTIPLTPYLNAAQAEHNIGNPG